MEVETMAVAYEPTDIRDVVPVETYTEHIELLAAELAAAVNERDALRGALARALSLIDRNEMYTLVMYWTDEVRALLAGQEGSGGV
jgi:hypothetical protein